MRNCEYFSNKECEYFPCHKTDDKDNFNCLFCYCPLFALGEKCQGSFSYTEDGVKDCSDCMFPHIRENYQTVVERLTEAIKSGALGAGRQEEE